MNDLFNAFSLSLSLIAACITDGMHYVQGALGDYCIHNEGMISLSMLDISQTSIL